MLRSTMELDRYKVTGLDGDVGTVADLLLDDVRWAVRYLVVQTVGVCGERRRVNVPPGVFRGAEMPTQRFHLALTVDRILAGPSAPVDTPSAREVCGYRVEGSDHTLGRVEDCLVDDEAWVVRYLVVDTSDGAAGRRALVAPQWARVDWSGRRLHLGLPRQALEEGPAWRPGLGVTRDYEAMLHQHHGRPGYWEA